MGEMKVTGFNVGEYGKKGVEYKPETDTSNYFRQQSTFTAIQEINKSTPYIDDISAYLSDDKATDRDKRAFDIAARSLNVSGFKFLKGTDMEAFFNAVNKDDFTNGQFSAKSDGKVKLFSLENDGTYGIIDEGGNILKFNKDGKFTDCTIFGGDTIKDKDKALKITAQANDSVH